MHRRPPVNAPAGATLFEKFPHLEAEWKNGHHAGYRDLYELYQNISNIDGSQPIDWEKPESFGVAARACGELVATSNLTHNLAMMAYKSSLDFDAPRDDAQQQELAYHTGALNMVLMTAQHEMETLEAVAEYRWLQANVNGDFAAMPKSLRERYTHTSALLDKRFEHVKRTAEDPEKLRSLQGATEHALAHVNTRVGELEDYMIKAGPLFANYTRETRAQSVNDYNTCLGEFIPHMRDQLSQLESQVVPLVRHATFEMTTKRKGAEGYTSKVGYLPVDFQKPEDAPSTDQPNPNNVTDIMEAHRIRAAKAEKGK